MDIWADGMDDIDNEFGYKLRDIIVIGGNEGEQQLILVPLKKNNCECWHFSSWPIGYKGLNSLLPDHAPQKNINGICRLFEIGASEE
jgi:hypothetical protein